MDSVSGPPKTEAGPSGEPASFSHPIFMAVGYCFRRLCLAPPEFIPWQRASGSVGPLTHPLMLQLVKTRREAPYQSLGRRRVAAPRAHTESLIEPRAESGAPLIRGTAALFALWGLVVVKASPGIGFGSGRWRAGWRWGGALTSRAEDPFCEVPLCLPEPPRVQPRTGLTPLLMRSSALAALAPGSSL